MGETGEAPRASGLKLSVVVPALNEGSNVAVVVDEVRATLDREMPGAYEILLVDDGSKDDTGAIMDTLAGRHPCVKAFHHPVNKGFGGALKTGFAAARGEHVSFVPGDGEVSISEVVKLLRDMGTADLMVSSRVRSVPSSRRILSWGNRVLTRLILGFDPSGMEGLYVIRRDLLARLRLRSDTGLLHIEVPMKCFRAGAVVKRGLIDTRPRISGVSKVANTRSVIRNLWEMLKLRLRG